MKCVYIQLSVCLSWHVQYYATHLTLQHVQSQTEIQMPPNRIICQYSCYFTSSNIVPIVTCLHYTLTAELTHVLAGLSWRYLPCLYNVTELNNNPQQAEQGLYLEDDGADESVDRPGKGFRDSGPLETPQHDSPFTEDGEEVQHLCQTRNNPILG